MDSMIRKMEYRQHPHVLVMVRFGAPVIKIVFGGRNVFEQNLRLNVLGDNNKISINQENNNQVGFIMTSSK